MSIAVNTKGGKSYVNGITPDSTWQKKMMDAGCTATTTGGLKIPDGKDAKVFLEETIGAAKLEKYGVVVEYNDLSAHPAQKDAGKQEKPQKEAAAPGALSVALDNTSGKLIVAGLHDTDKEAHKIIKEHGGKFVRDKDNPHWEIENPQIKQAALYKLIKATLSPSEAKSEKGEKKDPAFEVALKAGKSYVNGIAPDSAWQKKMLAAGCTVTKTGGLKIPDGERAPEFLTRVLGKENILKYGGYTMVKPEKVGKTSNEEGVQDIINADKKIGEMTSKEFTATLHSAFPDVFKPSAKFSQDLEQ